MQKLITFLLLTLAVPTLCCAQLPSYQLPKPAGWGSETFALPPAFAKEITFTGTEDIRFTPGWSRSTDGQYWSYAFVWLVEGKHTLTEKVLAGYMTAYYKGIYTVNLKDKPAPRPDFTSSSFRKIQTAAGDEQTFEGTVRTLNYLNHKALALNVRVHLRGVANGLATAMLFEVSPQPFSHAVWKDLNNVLAGFKTTAAK